MRACMCAYKAYKLTSAKISQVSHYASWLRVSTRNAVLNPKRCAQNDSPVMKLILKSYFFPLGSLFCASIHIHRASRPGIYCRVRREALQICECNNVDIQLSDQWPTGCILQPGGSSQLLLLLVTFLVGRWLPRISLKSMPWCQNNVRTCQLGNL